MADMTPEDARAILGLTALSTAQCIRRARRKLVRAHHPDLVPRHQRARSDRMLAEINTAFDLLIALHGTRRTPWESREQTAGPSAPPKPAADAQPNRATHGSTAHAPTTGRAPTATATATPYGPDTRASAPAHGPKPALHAPARAGAWDTGADRRAHDAFEAGLRAISRGPAQPSRTEYA